MIFVKKMKKKMFFYLHLTADVALHEVGAIAVPEGLCDIKGIELLCNDLGERVGPDLQQEPNNLRVSLFRGQMQRLVMKAVPGPGIGAVFEKDFDVRDASSNAGKMKRRPEKVVHSAQRRRRLRHQETGALFVIFCC